MTTYPTSTCPADRAHNIPEHERGSMPERCTQCAIAWANSRDPYTEVPVPPWAQRFGLPRPGYSRVFTSGAGNRYRVRGPLVRVTWADPAWRPTTLTFDTHRQAVAYARLHGRESR